jgi:hypothetical protein
LKKATKQNIELPALVLTAVLKLLLMDWLQWRGVFIAGICLFWLGYVIFQFRTKNQLHLWGFGVQRFNPNYALEY